MNEQPDKLFRDKLKCYQKPVSPDGWNRVAANIGKGKKSNLWLKIAAAILLLAVAGTLLFNDILQTPQIAIVETKESTLENPRAIGKEPELKRQIVTENPDRPLPDQKTNKLETTPSQKERRNPVEKTVVVPSQKQAMIKQAEAEDEILPVIANEAVPLEAVTVRKNESTACVEENLRVKLEFRAEEVNEKYLKKSALADATSEEKKPSTLRKLLDKAYDLKHNQDPLGELRQKKNEIFALNFKSDKQRSENK